MTADFDLIVVGSGFGGTILSRIAMKLGLRTLLLERGTHPRFAIGESTSPLSNLILEELAIRYDLQDLLPLTSYGTWQEKYPDLPCGLKRGFTFFEHFPAERCQASHNPKAQLMVAASPDDSVADTHWYRAALDKWLVDGAIQKGVDFQDRTEIQRIHREEDSWILEGASSKYSCRFLVDATGPRGLLFRLFSLKDAGFDNFPATQAIYSHFTGVKRCEDHEDFASPAPAPYPMDSAAVHHIFPGGWMWSLPFNNGVTSAGVVVEEEFANRFTISEGKQEAWKQFLSLFPSISDLFIDAEPVQPFYHTARVSFRSSLAAGDGWAMLPSAASSIDALFSTGIPLTLLGIQRLARLLEKEKIPNQKALKVYSEITLSEADNAARYIEACRRSMSCFSLFTSLSMFYFAAASYSEMARRLQKLHLASRYLASDREEFMAGFYRCMDLLPSALDCKNQTILDRFEFLTAEAIHSLNVAGLCDSEKQNRYWVDMNDLILSAGKLEMTQEQMRSLLASAPWANFG